MEEMSLWIFGAGYGRERGLGFMDGRIDGLIDWPLKQNAHVEYIIGLIPVVVDSLDG